MKAQCYWGQRKRIFRKKVVVNSKKTTRRQGTHRYTKKGGEGRIFSSLFFHRWSKLLHELSPCWEKGKHTFQFIISPTLLVQVVIVVVLVTQSCPTLCDPTDCSPPGSSVHGILQARVLEWIAVPFFRGSSWPRDWTWISWVAGRFFTIWATGKTF